MVGKENRLRAAKGLFGKKTKGHGSSGTGSNRSDKDSSLILGSDGKLSSEKEPPEANFSWSIPDNADFTNATLTNALFLGVVAYQAKFNNAKLSGASFAGSVLGKEYYASCFRGADLRGANFRDTVLIHVSFTGADLRGANLCNANLSGVYFDENTNMTGAVIDEKTIIDIAELRKAIGGDVLADQLVRLQGHAEQLTQSDDGLAADHGQSLRGSSREVQEHGYGESSTPSPVSAEGMKKPQGRYTEKLGAERQSSLRTQSIG